MNNLWYYAHAQSGVIINALGRALSRASTSLFILPVRETDEYLEAELEAHAQRCQRREMSGQH